jgi:hypothetical protein
MPGVAVQALQQSALENSFRRVEPKQARRCRTDNRNRFDQRTVNPEMICPTVTPGVKKPNNLSCARLD